MDKASASEWIKTQNENGGFHELIELLARRPDLGEIPATLANNPNVARVREELRKAEMTCLESIATVTAIAFAPTN